jgi:uncharacterized protein (TIGR02145 family)
VLPELQFNKIIPQKSEPMNKEKIVLFCLCCILGVSLLISGGCKKKDDDSGENPVPAATVKDIDGNIYHTVTIGTQVWMLENLRTTKYRNGQPIPNVTDNFQWMNLATGAYCMYNNDFSLASTYGLLYNWFAVSASGNLCPTGWHVPTEEDWQTLETYLGGSGLAGGKLKETGTVHWKFPNTDATNQTGFTALPGGLRTIQGDFLGLEANGAWWSSSEKSLHTAWSRTMYYQYSVLEDYDDGKESGFSIRCIKDQAVK